MLRGGPCGRNGDCSVHAAFAAAEEAMIAALASVSLADVSNEQVWGCDWKGEGRS